MSEAYDKYLYEHITNVQRAFAKLCEYFPEYKQFEAQIKAHDASKYSSEEYRAYDRHWYGDGKGEEEYKRAWLHHIHANPHHWQHWVIIDEDPPKLVAVDMPVAYVIEMICDWWSFSFKSGNLYEIFNWLDLNARYILLSENTQNFVEDLLNRLEFELDSDPSVERK